MKKIIEMYLFAVITVFILVVPYHNVAYCIETDSREEALEFVENAAGLDMTKYAVRFVNQLVTEGTMLIIYNFTSAESIVAVSFQMENNELKAFTVTPIRGSEIHAKSGSDLVLECQTFLQEYGIYTQSSYTQPLQSMLSKVEHADSTEREENNIRLIITVGENVTQFDWMKKANGIYNMYNKITVSFRNGILESFCNTWNKYTIGNTEVTISMDKAGAIAKESVESYSYQVGNTVVNNLRIKDEQISAILTMQPRAEALYPHWEISMGLNQTYPGYKRGVQVLLWADTGEVTHITVTGGLGTFTDEPTPTGNPLPLQSDSISSISQKPVSSPTSSEINGNIDLVNTGLILGIAALAVLAMSVVVIKRFGKNH